jgi:hypothetical protein
MPKSESPYRRSIWDQDERYKVDDISFSDVEKATIYRLMSVDAAKKNTPPIPLSGLLLISSLAKAMPKSEAAQSEDVESYLANVKEIHGAGIPTAICMLSVETAGDYPPIDEKFSAGMKASGVITEAEETSLRGTSKSKFAKIYVEKIIPAWKNSLNNRTAQEADNYWGRGGKNG